MSFLDPRPPLSVPSLRKEPGFAASVHSGATLPTLPQMLQTPEAAGKGQVAQRWDMLGSGEERGEEEIVPEETDEEQNCRGSLIGMDAQPVSATFHLGVGV